MAFMERLQTTSTRALRHLLDSQPLSSAKVTFAWRMAAGATLARAASAEWREDGTLVVTAATRAWLQELRRARPVLTERLESLLGAGVIKQLVLE
jgi:predicted nucleic acid-binding Zn ribbon protein